MSELRAPDPTLTAFDGLVAVYDLSLPAPVAHEPDDEGLAVCEFVSIFDAPFRLDAADAAYFAVPCRECFPDSPPPGWRTSDEAPAGIDGLQCVADPHLAWQVQP